MPARTISRRDFFRKVAVYAAGVSVTGAVGKFSIGAVAKELGKTEEDRLREAIEGKFNIRLTTTKQRYGSNFPWVAYSAGITPEEYRSIPEKWNKGRLEMLPEFFGYLPPHFLGTVYGSREDLPPLIKDIDYFLPAFLLQKKLDINLGYKSSCCRAEGSFQSEIAYKHRVNLYHDFFKPEGLSDKSPIQYPLGGRQIAFLLLIHELGHVVDFLDTGVREGMDIRYRSAYGRYMISLLYKGDIKDFRKYLGEAVVNSEMVQLLNSKWKQKIPMSSEETYLFFSYLRINSVVEDDNPYIIMQEMVATASELYVFGRDHFVRMYSQFFPQVNAEKLWEYVRKEIFKGREYPENFIPALKESNLISDNG